MVYAAPVNFLTFVSLHSNYVNVMLNSTHQSVVWTLDRRRNDIAAAQTHLQPPDGRNFSDPSKPRGGARSSHAATAINRYHNTRDSRIPRGGRFGISGECHLPPGCTDGLAILLLYR